VTWATSVPILVFLGLCSLLRPDVHDRQTDVRQHHRLTYARGLGHNNVNCEVYSVPVLTVLLLDGVQLVHCLG